MKVGSGNGDEWDNSGLTALVVAGTDATAPVTDAAAEVAGALGFGTFDKP